MAQAGFTPIRLYYSTTALATPSAVNLTAGELAINITDEKLYFKNAGGTVKLLADSALVTGNLPGGSIGTVVYQASTGVTAYLPLGTTNWVLTAGPTAPQYTNPSTLSVGSATTSGTATNLAGGAANRIPFQTGAGATSFISTPTSVGYVLGWDGISFTWVVAPAATSAVDLAGGTAGELPYQIAAGDTGFTTGGVAGYLLSSNGTSAPTWSNPSSITVGNATNAVTSTNLAGGAASQIAYQTAVGTTGFLPNGTAGQVLVSNGAAAPTWQTQVPAVTTAFVYFCANF